MDPFMMSTFWTSLNMNQVAIMFLTKEEKKLPAGHAGLSGESSKEQSPKLKGLNMKR